MITPKGQAYDRCKLLDYRIVYRGPSLNTLTEFCNICAWRCWKVRGRRLPTTRCVSVWEIGNKLAKFLRNIT